MFVRERIASEIGELNRNFGVFLGYVKKVHGHMLLNMLQ